MAERLFAVDEEHIPYISVEASELVNFPGTYKAFIKNGQLFIRLTSYLYIFMGREALIRVQEDGLNVILLDEYLKLHQITAVSELMYELGYNGMKIYGEQNQLVLHFDKIVK